MKKWLTKLIVGLLLMISASLTAQVSTWDGSWEPWTHGTGTENDPFLIENAQQLAYLAYRVNNGLDGQISNHDYHYKLMTNVNLNNIQWDPIGYINTTTDYNSFGGWFDGNQHVISGLYNNQGFFGCVSGANIKNITIAGNVNGSNTSYSGGVVGYIRPGVTNITNCSNECNISNPSLPNSGGIVGYIYGSNNNPSYTTVLINNCCNKGNISVSNSGYAGGIVGNGWGHVVINNCYNVGALTGSHVGGIIGGCVHYKEITNCYNVGTVNGSHDSGGILGNNSTQYLSVTNSYYLNTCGGNNNYGTPWTYIQMQSGEFVSLLNNGSCAWNADVWNNNSGYPVLTMIIILTLTDEATDITQSHATLQGTISVENTSVLSQGFEYKRISDYDYQTIAVSGSGGISTTISNLMPNTQYQYRTFCATNDDCGMTYGEEEFFTTQSIVITTNNATDITQTHATLNGNLNIGDANISSQGFEYKKSSDNEWQSVSVSGSGDISKTLSDLVPNTQYRFRTYCTPEGCETVYGQDKTFNTLAISVTTNNASDVTQAHATLNGTINAGDANISSQGFEYKKSSDNEWQSVSVSGSGDISKTLSDLVPNTQYRFRTFCTPVGCETVYGQEKTFNTLAISVTTNNATDVTQTHATLHGAINAGDANISTQGFEYKKATDNTWQATWVSGNGDISKTLSGLSYNKQYYFRTFCTLQGGETVYGQEKSFNTLAITISTNNATNVTQTHATLEGNVNSGDANVWAGFEYKTQGTSWHTVNVSGSGNITKTLSNLIPNTHYIYRTYCSITENGTIYGEEREFTTMNVYAATDPATEIDNNSAVLHGFVNIGDATLINKGFEYYLVNPSVECPFVVYVTDENYDFSAELEGLDMFSNGGSMYMYKTFVTIAEKEGTIYGNDEVFSWYDAREILVYDMDMMFSIAGACYNGETFENKTIILLNNIEFPVASENFISIGSYPDNPFRGTFYGNGKTISNLALGQTNMHYQGLFGYTQGAMISSLMLDNANIYGRNYCGGIVAYADNTFIYESCIVNSSINALNYCGGIVGYVEGENTDVMGCYSTCNVSGNNYVGGLVGNSNMGAVRNSYAAGSVSGHGNAVGGILGGAHETLMINCYFNTDITGQSVAIGENYFKDGEGVTTTQMRMPQFVATMNQGITPAIWIADNIPYINNGFPILYWQTSGGESCGAPQNLSHSISGNQITLSWDIVDEADYYIVKYATINGIEHTQVTEQNSFTFNAVQDSIYSWRVKSVCPYGESVFVNGNNVGLGVDENDAISNYLMLYPNPANELVTIKLDNENYGLKKIKLFDISGREVVSVNVSGQEYNIDVSGLPKGIYFVRVVTDDNNVANLKLLVQ